MKTIESYMTELESFGKDAERSRGESETEKHYGKRIRYFWETKESGSRVDFFSLREARSFFREKLYP